MRKPKVLILIDAMNGGGAERVLSFVLREIDQTRFEVTLYLVVKEGMYLNQIPDTIPVLYLFAGDSALKHPIIRVLNKAYRAVAYRLAFRYTFLLPWLCRIKPHTYDLAVSFCEGYNTLLLGAIRNRFAKIIQWLQVDVRQHEATFNPKAFARAILKMDAWVGVSTETLVGCNERYGALATHIPKHVVYNPVDVNRIVTLAEHAHMPYQVFTCVAIGRLQHQKRFDRLIEAHALLIAKGFNLHTIILGKGELLKQLQVLCKKLGITDSVRFEGFQPNVYPWIKHADMFVLSSDYEGFPGVVCEAMVLCKPIVATRITGTLELLENGKWGLLADATTESLAMAMEQMIRDATLRNQFTDKLTQNQGNFLFKNHIDDVVHVIERYLPA
jgi:glycosyltransferase involved in cell wall biosynthesis